MGSAGRPSNRKTPGAVKRRIVGLYRKKSQAKLRHRHASKLAHLDAVATKAEIRRQRDVHRPVCAALIEDKGNGQAIVQSLKSNVPGVAAINPQGGKVARMFAAAPEWLAGDWYVDRNAAWTEPFS